MGFEDGVFDFDQDAGDDAFAHIDPLEVFLCVVIDAFEEAFAEGGEVCASIGCVLSVDEGVVVFAIVLGVEEGKFEVGGFVVEGFGFAFFT